MLKPRFIRHYKMRSDGCFDMALWVIKPYTVGFYCQCDDNTVIGLIIVSLFFFHCLLLPFSLRVCDALGTENRRYIRVLIRLHLWMVIFLKGPHYKRRCYIVTSLCHGIKQRRRFRQGYSVERNSLWWELCTLFTHTQTYLTYYRKGTTHKHNGHNTFLLWSGLWLFSLSLPPFLPHSSVNVSILGLYQWVTFTCPLSSAS